MIKCELCEKEFKTKQGVAGHMLWVHNRPSRKQLPLLTPRRFITDEELLHQFKVRDRSIQTLRESVIALSERTFVLLSKLVELKGKQSELKKAHNNLVEGLKDKVQV